MCAKKSRSTTSFLKIAENFFGMKDSDDIFGFVRRKAGDKDFSIVRDLKYDSVALAQVQSAANFYGKRNLALGGNLGDGGDHD